MTRRWLPLVIALVIWSGACSGEDSATTMLETTAAVATTARTTTPPTAPAAVFCQEREPGNSCTDYEYLEETMIGIRFAVEEWNASNLAWITDSNDASVSDQQFAESSMRLIERQTDLVLAIRWRIDQLPTQDLQAAFGPLEDHFQDRLDALRPLVTATLSGTQAEYDQALAAYRDTASPAQAISMVEAILRHATVEGLLREQGVEPDQIIELFEETFLGG